MGDADFAGYGCAMLRGFGPLYTAEDVYIGNLLGALSALDAGTTTMLDWSHALNTPEHADAAIAALRTSGIRALFAQGWSRADGQNWTQNSTLRHNPDIIRVRREVLSDDSALVTHYMAGRGPEMTTTEVVKQDFALARELGIRISMHVGVRDFGPRFRAIEVMAEAGVLGPDLTLIHVCASSAHEMKLMADHGVSASIGPQAEMMTDGCGIPAVGRLLAAGIRPSLSGDTETMGTGDLFTQMRLAIAAERLLATNSLLPDTVPPVKVRDMLDFATIVGAEACGLADRVGSLSPGKQADIAIVRATDLNLAPVSDPAGALVLAAHPGNVETVLVAGEVRKRDGKLVGIDLDAVRARALASRDGLLARHG
jgi:cytosine/adenosine deaminase-related metal-dependent hydrolase